MTRILRASMQRRISSMRILRASSRDDYITRFGASACALQSRFSALLFVTETGKPRHCEEIDCEYSDAISSRCDESECFAEREIKAAGKICDTKDFFATLLTCKKGVLIFEI